MNESTDVWFAEGKVIYDQNRLAVARVSALQDAPLVAAAPDLLAMLKEALDWIDREDDVRDTGPMVTRLRAAIANASEKESQS